MEEGLDPAGSLGDRAMEEERGKALVDTSIVPPSGKKYAALRARGTAYCAQRKVESLPAQPTDAAACLARVAADGTRRSTGRRCLPVSYRQGVPGVAKK
jgi:hypothetical protein